MNQQKSIYVCEQILTWPDEDSVNRAKEWMRRDLFCTVGKQIKLDTPYTIKLKEESHVEMGAPYYGSELKMKFSLFISEKCQGTSQTVTFLDVEDL